MPCFTSTILIQKQGSFLSISEEGYPTLDICNCRIRNENKQDEEFKQDLLDNYEEQMRNFVLDLDDSDREPANPLLAVWRYDKEPHLYIFDKGGHHEITEHCIKDLFNLNISAEQIEKVNAILNGTLDPETFDTVAQWVSVCFSKPGWIELKLRAINEVLEGYGIESLRTTKWKNGHWCDVLCSYVNMGDSYIPTVIHHRKHGFMVATGGIHQKNKHVI